MTEYSDKWKKSFEKKYPDERIIAVYYSIYF